MTQLSQHRVPVRGPWLAATALVLLAGLGMTYFGTMRVVTGLTLLPSDPTLDSIQQLKPVPDAALDRLIAAQASALAVTDDSRIWGYQGLALGLKASLAQQAGTSADKVSALRDEAKDALVKSLQGAPANPYVWTRLAVLTEEAEGPPETALSYWRYAQLTGPNEPRLRLARIKTGILLWSLMNDADRATLARDLVNSWPADQEGIVTLADNDFARAVVRSSLLADLQKLMQFEKEYAKTHKALK